MSGKRLISEPAAEQVAAAFKAFDWLARMRPEMDRRKREREKELRQ